MRVGKNKLIVGTLMMGGVLAIAYGILFVAGMLAAPRLEEVFRPRTSTLFVSEVWKASTFGDKERYEMANHIVASGTLLNRSREGVEMLLGPPDRHWYGPVRTNAYYDLGLQKDYPARTWLLPSRSFWNIETWVLDVEYDAGKVKSVKIRSG
jgi:hypothetical protein